MIKGQQREEPYEATSLKYGFEAAVGWVTDPPTATGPCPVKQSEHQRS
jgi:hypothetical protein